MHPISVLTEGAAIALPTNEAPAIGVGIEDAVGCQRRLDVQQKLKGLVRVALQGCWEGFLNREVGRVIQALLNTPYLCNQVSRIC